jgi:hypothetical protein
VTRFDPAIGTLTLTACSARETMPWEWPLLLLRLWFGDAGGGAAMQAGCTP